MNNLHSPEVAVLLSETGHDYAIADELMRSGFVVYVCANAQELSALVRSGKRPVVLSEAAQSGTSALQADPHALTRLVYSRAPAGPGAVNGHAGGAPRANVSVHLGGGANSVVLNTIVATMQRCLYTDVAEAPLPPVAASWQLAHRPRRLLSPDGHGIPLTLTEWQFLTHLFNSPDRTLGYQTWQDISSRGTQRKLHNVVVLVSRLRRKAQRAGMDLPLIAVRGTGYAFTRPCSTQLPPS